MKKLIFALAALAVSLIPAWSQTVVGTPSQGTITLVATDPTAGAVCSPGGSIQINIYGGNNWLCSGPVGTVIINGAATSPFSYIWTLLGGSGKGFTPGIGTAIAAATTIAPVNSITHITGTTAIVNITNPGTIQNGAKIELIFDAIASWTAAGNIKVASSSIAPGGTIVAGQAYDFVWDATTALWYAVL